MDYPVSQAYNQTPALVNADMSTSTKRNLRHEISDNTRTSYSSDLNHYDAWLLQEGRPAALPHTPTMIADYLSYCDDIDLSIATIKRRVQAIAWEHRTNGHYESPTRNKLIGSVITGMTKKRLKEGRSTSSRSKAPATADILKTILNQCSNTSIIGIRDRALLLIGFAMAGRRSEIVSLTVPDITITAQGADILIRNSKTDKTGQGEVVSIVRSGGQYCPIKALQVWLKTSGIRSGFLFRRISKAGRILDYKLAAATVAEKVKAYACQAGLNPQAFAAHSLRSGMLTTAAENGADLIPLAQHARHKNTNQTMHYIQSANRYKNNPTEGIL